MKQIVVGISEAETSRVAAQQALRLAEQVGASVHFVTAIEAGDHYTIQVGSDRYDIDSADVARTAIESYVRSLAPTVDWTVEAVDGKPAQALIDVAERIKADLIVVGNVRMQGVGRILGSVGNEVVHHAPCSVLIVKTV